MNNINTELRAISGQYTGAEVIDNTHTAQAVRTYNAHPYKTNFLIKIVNWVYEFFSGRRTAVLVKVAGHNDPLFVKVSELTKYIPTLAKNVENATDVILQNNIERTVKDIFAELNKSEDGRLSQRESYTTAVKQYIPYQNLSSLVNSITGFEPKTMLLTISEIGRRMLDPTLDSSAKLTKVPSRGAYGFDINEGVLSIYDENGPIKVSVNALTLETTTILKPAPTPAARAAATPPPSKAAAAAVAPPRSPLMMFPGKGDVKKMQKKRLMEVVTKEFKNDKGKIQHCKAALKKMPVVNILRFLNEQADDANRTRVLNTLVEIGKQSKVTPFKLPSRYTRKLSRTLSFVTTDTQTILILDKNEKVGDTFVNILGKGTFKEVTKAIDLTTYTPLARVGLRSSVESLQQNGEMQKALEEECHLANEIAKESTHCAPKFQIAKAKDGSTAILQKRFSLQGFDLRKAFPEHQLKGLTDLAHGAADLHRAGRLHLDLKPNNCLVQGNLKDRSKHLTLKLTDFGTVQPIGQAKPNGTPFFMAPEVFRAYAANRDIPSLNVTDKADSYSLGVSIWSVVTTILSERPSLAPDEEVSIALLDNYDPNDAWVFPSQNIPDAREQLQQSIAKEKDSIRKQMLEVALDLIDLNPKDRISCEEAAQRLAAIKP